MYMFVCIYVYMLPQQTDAFWIWSTDLKASAVDTCLPIVVLEEDSVSHSTLLLNNSTDNRADSVISARTKEAEIIFFYSKSCRQPLLCDAGSKL